MKLTGKAKEDFENWLELDEDLLCGLDLFQLTNTCIDALIIEWFDSVGIFIGIKPFNEKTFIYFDAYLNFEIHSVWDTRQEATEKAIEKANSIYNDRFSK